MKLQIKSKAVLWRALLAGMFVFSLLAITPLASLAQTTDPVDYCLMTQNCTANDFGDIIVDNTVLHTVGCDVNNQVEVSFDLYFTSASSTRYDVGMVLSQDGGDAMRDLYMDGDCYRDYLPAPLITTDNTTLWPVACTEDTADGLCFWDAESREAGADLCGDLGDQDQALIHVVREKVECIDTDGDNQIDFSICQVYDNNAQNLCTTLTDATTGTVAKCDCQRVNLPITPTSVSLADFSARASQGYLWGGLGLLLAAGAAGSYWLYRRQTRTTI